MGDAILIILAGILVWFIIKTAMEEKVRDVKTAYFHQSLREKGWSTEQIMKLYRPGDEMTRARVEYLKSLVD